MSGGRPVEAIRSLRLGVVPVPGQRTPLRELNPELMGALLNLSRWSFAGKTLCPGHGSRRIEHEGQPNP